MPIGLPTNRRQIAELLIALGPKRAAEMLRALEPDRVEQIVADMATVDMTQEQAKDVLKDFTRDLLAKRAAPAGFDLARAVLVDLYGADEAKQISRRVDPLQNQPFLWLSELDHEDAATMLEKEPPGTIALALAHLPASVSAQILRRLAEPKRSDVAFRVANLSVVAPDVVLAIDASLRERVDRRTAEPEQKIEGVDVLVELLGQTGPKLQKGIIEAIKEQDDGLAGRIQERLFIFDDVAMLSDSAIQQVLKSIDTMDLAFSLQSADDAIKDLIFRNLSERARDALKEEIDYLQSPKAAEVKAARNRIIAVVRELEESGIIEIDRPGVSDEEDGDE
jgi:flagellar motor switch protein FliG